MKRNRPGRLQPPFITCVLNVRHRPTTSQNVIRFLLYERHLFPERSSTVLSSLSNVLHHLAHAWIRRGPPAHCCFNGSLDFCTNAAARRINSHMAAMIPPVKRNRPPETANHCLPSQPHSPLSVLCSPSFLPTSLFPSWADSLFPAKRARSRQKLPLDPFAASDRLPTKHSPSNCRRLRTREFSFLKRFIVS